MRILLVEDDNAQALGLRHALIKTEPLSLHVTRVARLDEARHVLQAPSFDAILLDLKLPDSSGLATFRGIREAAPDVPVIVFSANDDEAVAQQAVAEGAQDYLVKGEVGSRDLMRCVRYSIERHRAQSAAMESEERFRLLVEGVQDYAIIMLDPDGRVASWNPGAQRIHGYTADEMLGKHVSSFYPNDDVASGLAEAHVRNAAEHGSCRAQGWRLRKDGSRFYADVTITTLNSGNGRRRGFSVVTRDMTVQKRTAEDLLAYQERLRRLAAELNRNEDAERRRLAAILHDGISQSLAAAQIKIDTLPEDSVTQCGTVLTQVRELISEAIALTRRMTLDLSPPVLYQVGLPAALVALTEQVRRRHNIAAEVHCTGMWEPMMKTETRGLLYQAIRELVNNVIKHARATRLQILLFRRNPSPDGAPGSIRVRVIDDGSGFDASTVTSPEGRPEGFGLFNLRERLTHAQGWMVIRSQAGRGTEVEFEVPIELVVSKQAHETASA